jgi:hypothetical protein
MTLLTVYISVAREDGEFALQLADALMAAGAIALPREQAQSGGAPSTSGRLEEARALVVLLSFEAVSDPVIGDEVRRYTTAMGTDPTRMVVPVLLEPVPAASLPPALQAFEPVTAPPGATRDALIGMALRRLGLTQEERAPGAVVLPAPLSAHAPGEPNGAWGAPLAPRLAEWKQQLLARRRHVALGGLAALLLLLFACIAFSLGTLSPGKGQSDSLGSRLPGATQTPLASPTAPAATNTAILATATAAATATAQASATATTVLPTATPTLGPGTGLRGDYYHTTKQGMGTPVPYPNFGSFWFSRTDPSLYFGYGNQSRTYSPPVGPFDAQVCPSPPSSTPCAAFGVRWTGFVRAQYSETYTFYTDADDGVKLWVNGQLIVDNWQVQPDTQESGTVSLTAGQLVPIQIEYYENGEGPATMALQWSGPSQPFQAIPQSQLYPPAS